MPTAAMATAEPMSCDCQVERREAKFSIPTSAPNLAQRPSERQPAPWRQQRSRSSPRARRRLPSDVWLLPAWSCRRVQEGADPLSVLRSCGVVDHHAEVRAAIDAEGRVFKCQEPGPPMPDAFGALAVAAHVVVAPHCGELRTQSGQLVDQRLGVARSAGPCGVRSECRHDKPCYALPVSLRGAHLRVQE